MKLVAPTAFDLELEEEGGDLRGLKGGPSNVVKVKVVMIQKAFMAIT